MSSRLRSVCISTLLGCSALFGGCATIAGTLVSPVTGGVDLVQESVSRYNWIAAPPVFLGGMIAGPFVALHSGVNHDASIFRGYEEYWKGFHKVFRPFHMVRYELDD